MTVRKFNTRGTWKVEVSFIYQDGDYHIHKSGDGLAPCELWAEIAPDPSNPGDWMYVGVYLENVFCDGQNTLAKLEGRHEAEGIEILQTDSKWQRWASEEYLSMREEAA